MHDQSARHRVSSLAKPPGAWNPEVAVLFSMDGTYIRYNRPQPGEQDLR